MRIWYLNHFASAPDQPTTGAYFLMDALAGIGHEVTVFASGFNYYLRNDKKMNGHWLARRERVERIDFLWLRTFPTQGRIFTRLLNMGSYFMMAIAAGLFTRNKPDVVIGTCPHPLAGLAAWILAKTHGAKFVYEIRDIWPESMTEGNHISEDNPFMRAMMALQLFLYRRAFLITSVIPRLDEYLKSKGIKHFRFLWSPNGTRIDKSKLPAPSGGPESKSETFKIFYFGGHSKHQGLDTLIETADLLRHIPTLPVRIVMVGEGTEKPRLMEKARKLGLANLEFRPAVPRAQVMQMAAEADCFVAHAYPLPILRYGNGLNKLCDFMLAGRPIINASGAGNDPVGDNHCGVGGVPPMTPQAIVDAIHHIHALSPDARRSMGERAQAYAMRQFDAFMLARQLDEALR